MPIVDKLTRICSIGDHFIINDFWFDVIAVSDEWITVKSDAKGSALLQRAHGLKLENCPMIYPEKMSETVTRLSLHQENRNADDAN